MNALSLNVDSSLTVRIIPNQLHEFLMTSKEVAFGYGVKDGTIRESLRTHSDELVEGKHFVKGVSISDTLAGTNLQPHQTFWTKRGIVRLGFFIKSDRARQFRDWAEDLIIYSQESNLPARIAELEAKLNEMTIQALNVPTMQQLSERRTDFFNQWLQRGDVGRIAEQLQLSYRYVQRVKLGRQPNARIQNALYNQCIENKLKLSQKYNQLIKN